MRKLYSFLAGILLIILVLWGVSYQIESRTQSKESDKLVIYNWGDYIDPELLTEFTKETGVQIQYDTFDSNEAMYTKVKQGGTTYDIAIPSEYMIAKMMKEGLVEKLDHSQIKGLENIGSDFLDQPFDPGNQYSIPYFWGTLGIVYNEKMVDKAPEHWNDLWSENSEYEAAKDEQAFVEGQISSLETKIRYAEIVNSDAVAKDEVAIGKTVTIQEVGESEEEVYIIVGSAGADAFAGKVSNESPIGQALIGKKTGDTATVETPVGSYDVKILKVEKTV